MQIFNLYIAISRHRLLNIFYIRRL